jgi:hypothetical protein
MRDHRPNRFTLIKIYTVEIAATVLFVAIVVYVVGFELRHLFLR